MFLNPQDFVQRIQDIAVPALPGLKVLTANSVDLKLSFGIDFPAIYFLKQYANRVSPGDSSHPLIQNWNWFGEFAVVTRRFDDSTETDTARRQVCQILMDSLWGWRPPGAFTALDADGYTDGDPADSIAYGVLRMHCTIHQRKL